ncbi:unnamed protein product [Prunus armeniaca]|uniref:Uncharacterized protein n=1 Tax=Prunus armeniaca TaxID=36596 RepID=A0A6J5XPG1_PRUAR|nr:unnamed protein product [Prunus armeniaca]
MAWGGRSWGAVGIWSRNSWVGEDVVGSWLWVWKRFGECDLGNRGLEVGKVAWVWRLTRWCVVELKERKRGEKSGDNWDRRGRWCLN